MSLNFLQMVEQNQALADKMLEEKGIRNPDKDSAPGIHRDKLNTSDASKLWK